MNWASPKIFLMGFTAIIGTGKTSAIKRFRETHALEKTLLEEHGLDVHVAFVLEPENMWVINTEEGNTLHLLEEFYKDRDMNAQPFQTIVFDTHVDVVEAAMQKARNECGGKDIVLIVERTMFDQLLFWKLQVDDKLKSATIIFDEAYMRIWRKWNRFLPPVSLIFFLRTSNLQGTMYRLKKREQRKALKPDRSVFHVSVHEEIREVGGITVEYQQALLEKHEAWYTQPYAHPPEAPARGIRCVHINVDAPYHEEDVSLFEMAHEMCSSMAEIIKGEYV